MLRLPPLQLLQPLLAVCVWLAPAGLPAAMTPPSAASVESEAIVIFKPTATVRSVCEKHAVELVKTFTHLSADRQFCHVRAAGQTTAAIIARLAADPAVEFVEPNYYRTLAAMPVPNDTQFSKQWPLRNTGQLIVSVAGTYGTVGTPGADIHFLDAWGMAKPSTAEIVIGVLDSGLDFVHPDLTPNLWSNPAEIPGDGLDNDGNGYVDDAYGYDFADGDPNPSDIFKHGTHLSAIIAGTINNAMGIAGAAFNARILPLKITHDDGTLSVDAELAAIDYAIGMKARGVNLVALNASFSSSIDSYGERDAIQAAGAAGIVFCTAAGNDHSDNTAVPVYPANYRLPNMIVVAASDSNDSLASYSNYGTKVDLAAPGVDIYSARPVWPTPYILPPDGQPPVTATLTCGGTSYTGWAAVYSATTPGLTATLHNCGFGASPGDFPAAVNGNIALIQRSPTGGATAATKVGNAMKAGAKAVILYMNSTSLVPLTLATPGLWIPAQSISQADGLALLAALPTTVTLATVPPPGAAQAPGPSRIYAFADGTSTATPFVTAAVAFAARNFPSETATQRVARVLNGVTPVGYLTGKVLTGGRLNLAGIVDPGGNAIPDWWETDYFGTIGINPSADPDGDGFTNLQEYRIGTQPNNPASKLAISQTAVVPNGGLRDFRITFPTATDVTYRVEHCDDLTPRSWTALGGDLTGTGNPASVTDPNAVTLHPSRFYRVRILTP